MPAQASSFGGAMVIQAATIFKAVRSVMTITAQSCGVEPIGSGAAQD